MMKHLFPILAAVALAAPAIAAPQIGGQAPNFRLTDTNGKAVTLGQFRGKVVVIEWNNPGCPYVKKHYGSGNMQRTQAAARQAGAVWLTVNSSATGKQGHMNGAQANAFVAAQKAQPTAYLLDHNGIVGKGYGAVTTPHMYIVDKGGKLVYAGGIDDKPTANPADINGARNHVLAALAELRAGKAVSVATSRPYGCSVKYADS
ncbi:MAG TPA: thioredoxin family protein [Allosphingosinicella sp.]|nr:thioredoxin family protein [Allosphingosinicella sp.]